MSRNGARTLPLLLAMGSGFLLVLALTGGVLTSLRGASNARDGATRDGVAAPESRGVERDRPRFDYWHRALPPTPPPEPDRIPRPEGPVESWPHDQLADLADPNVEQPGYVPLRHERAEGVAGGPRLAVAGLDARYTVDLGAVPISRSVGVGLGLVNVGDAPLVISRIYPSMSAIAFELAGTQRGTSGILIPSRSILPGERITLSLRLEPERLPEPGTRSVIVQIFSNDPAHEIFDAGDPLSHETRLRLIFEARDWQALQRPVAPLERPLEQGRPRLWIPELAVDGRGGDVLDLGRVPAGQPATVTLRLANVGRGPLEIDPDPAPRIIGRLTRSISQTSLQPAASAVLTFTLPPPEDSAPDFAVPVREELRLTSNDPLAGEVLLAVRAVFGGEEAVDEEGARPGSGAGGDATPSPTRTPTPRSPIESQQDAAGPRDDASRLDGQLATHFGPHRHHRKHAAH